MMNDNSNDKVIFRGQGLRGAERHPEKAKNQNQPQPKRPDWLRVKAPQSKAFEDTRDIVREHHLVTVCEEAACPNIGECWQKKTRYYDDPWLCLHSCLCVLQCRHGKA